ncbi:MAG: hypothetical protein KDA72_09345, partial [Planctomycetales bacterium]|nr:hypothetical protein [Planctomycetales bacterium]
MNTKTLVMGLCVVAVARAVSAQSVRDSHSEANSPAWESQTTAVSSEGFEDDWKRPNGPLGNGWKSAHDDHPNWWDPLEIRQAAPVNTNPDKGPIVQPDNAAGRTAAYRDFGPAYA